MTESTQAPNSEESPISREQMQEILSEHFGEAATLTQIGTDQHFELNYGQACGSEYFQEDDSLSLVRALQALAAKALAAAAQIDEAAGYAPEIELFNINPCHREVGVICLDEEVSILVSNTDTDEQAITKARQAFALLTQGKKPIPHRHRVSGAAGGSGVSLRPSQPSEYRFWLGTEGVFENVEICVWGEADAVKSQDMAERFIAYLQDQKPDRKRLTA